MGDRSLHVVFEDQADIRLLADMPQKTSEFFFFARLPYTSYDLHFFTPLLNKITNPCVLLFLSLLLPKDFDESVHVRRPAKSPFSSIRDIFSRAPQAMASPRDKN